jgi:hypothetical protein
LQQRGEPYRDRVGNSGIPDPEGPRGRALRTALDLSKGRLVMNRADLRNPRKQVWPELWPQEELPRQTMAKLEDLLSFGAGSELVRRLRVDPLGCLRMPRPQRDYLGLLLRRQGVEVLAKPPRIELSTIHGVRVRRLPTLWSARR